jgi:hypothetical protein
MDKLHAAYEAVTSSELYQLYAFEISLILIGLAITAVSTTVWFAIKLQVERRRNKKEFSVGELRNEVVVSMLIIEEINGRVFLKPRVADPTQSSINAFVNQAMIDELNKAIARCDTTAAGSFIKLSDPKMHNDFMEKARAIASSITADGHAARAAGLPHIEKIFYAMVTFSLDGAQRKIRIDLLHKNYMSKFLDEEYVRRITGRPEEGSHDDLASICHVAAQKHATLPVKEADVWTLRTSLSWFASGMTAAEIERYSDK